MTPYRLPVSGLRVRFHQMTGTEDILLAEETVLDTQLALALVGALGRLENGEAVPWESLPVSDLDAALLVLRKSLIGDQIRASVTCAARKPLAQPSTGRKQSGESVKGCEARIDIAFRVGDYLDYHSPTVPSGVSPATEPDWFQLDGTEVIGRLPSCADHIEIAGRSDAERELLRRCIRPETAPARLRRKMESAMAKLAPSLYDELEGHCPECGATVRIFFDPMRYVLAELRERAIFVYEEVHLIAARYQWSEREILSMPGSRRARYAEFVHEAGAGA